jgi:hypothetical protein
MACAISLLGTMAVGAWMKSTALARSCDSASSAAT